MGFWYSFEKESYGAKAGFELTVGTQCDLELPVLTHLSSVGIAGVPPPRPSLEKDGFSVFYLDRAWEVNIRNTL